MKKRDQQTAELPQDRILARVHAKELSDVHGGAKSVSCGTNCDEIVSDGTNTASEAATSESFPDEENQI